MIELKSQNLASKDIWDSFQPYHGKKMSMLFGKLIYLFRGYLLFKCDEDQNADNDWTYQGNH